MGASLGTEPTHVVEIYLSQQIVDRAEQVKLCARVHTAAEGAVRYSDWGRVLPIGIWTDDVITITILKAESQEDAHDRIYDEYAEIYLPWDLVKPELVNDRASFEIAVQPNLPPLGHDAAFSKYFDAFKKSRAAVHEGDVVGTINIDIYWTPQGRVAGGGRKELTALALDELSPEEMKSLYQLQVANFELKAQLGVRPGDTLPEVVELLNEHLRLLGKTVAEYWRLKADIKVVDADILASCTSMSEEQCTAATQTLPREKSVVISDSQSTEKLQREIKAATLSNVELIAACAGQIREMEKHLNAAGQIQNVAPLREAEARRWAMDQQAGELQHIESECDRYRDFLTKEITRQAEQVNVMNQKLQLDYDVQVEEIGNLEQALTRQERDDTPMPPSTGLLQVESGNLQLNIHDKQRRNQEQEEGMQRLVDDLRRETEQLRGDFQHIGTLRAHVEAQLNELRSAATTAAPSQVAKEKEDMHQAMDAMRSKMDRCRKRMEINDVKVQQLHAEDEDMRLRAAAAVAMGIDVARSRSPMPRVPSNGGTFLAAARGGASPQVSPMASSKTMALQAEIKELENSLSEQMRLEFEVDAHMQSAHEALEAQMVEASVLDQKFKLLESRAAASQQDVVSIVVPHEDREMFVEIVRHCVDARRTEIDESAKPVTYDVNGIVVQTHPGNLDEDRYPVTVKFQRKQAEVEPVSEEASPHLGSMPGTYPSIPGTLYWDASAPPSSADLLHNAATVVFDGRAAAAKSRSVSSTSPMRSMPQPGFYSPPPAFRSPNITPKTSLTPQRSEGQLGMSSSASKLPPVPAMLQSSSSWSRPGSS